MFNNELRSKNSVKKVNIIIFYTVYTVSNIFRFTNQMRIFNFLHKNSTWTLKKNLNNFILFIDHNLRG